MTTSNDCNFCNADGKADKEKLKNEIPSSTGSPIPCKRGIFDDLKYCFAILCPEQYTIGHTLLILENHRTDITDNFLEGELTGFITAIHKVAQHLKAVVENEQGEHPERIYVNILCDGVEHLHAHLIPRYPFTEIDKRVYRKLFLQRDGQEVVIKNQQRGDMGGFWYLTDREINYKWSEFKLKTSDEQARILEEQASKWRIS